MIYPHPESDLAIDIMVLGARIMHLLRSGRSQTKKPPLKSVETVLGDFLQEDKKRTPAMFCNALVFLYIGDLIEKEGDAIRLQGKSRT